jgi:hypothetical protein
MNDSLEAGGLGSLAQAARTKQLKTAKSILIAIGIFTILANGVLGLFAGKMVDGEIEKEIATVRSQGMEIDQATVDEYRAATVRTVQLSSAMWCAVGGVFITLGFMVYKYPVPITIAGLVLYLGCIAITGAMAPETLAKGWIIKAFFIVGLFKSIQAAIASQKEDKEIAAAAGLAPL